MENEEFFTPPASDSGSSPENKKSFSIPLKFYSGSRDAVSSSHAFFNRELRQRLFPLLLVASLLCVLFALGLCSIFLIKPTVSEYERRELQTMPEFSFASLVSGEYLVKLENFYADTFPFRDTFVKLGAKIEESYGLRFDDVRIHRNQPVQNLPGSSVPQPNEAPPQTPKGGGEDMPQPAPTEKPPEVVDDGAVGEKLDSFFIYKNKGYSIFYENKEAVELYTDTINRYKELLGGDTTVYSLVIPSSIEFGLPKRYQSVSDSQKANIEYINSRLLPGIKRVDAYSELMYHSDEYIYFNTDHHWTGLGAYYAYTAFCKSAGLTPTPLEAMEKRTLTDFTGTLYSQTMDPSLLKSADYVDYFIIPSEYTAWQYRKGAPYSPSKVSLWGEYAKPPNSYSVYLHGDFPLTKIETENKNGRRILMVKESFGNAFAPFLAENYEEVYVVDQRYFEINLPAFIKENRIDEVLFINNIYAANTTLRAREIAGMIDKGLSPEKRVFPDEEAPAESEQSSGGQDTPKTQ